jgi:hypothetical protein
MHNRLLLFLYIALPLSSYSLGNWQDVAVIDGLEIYVDTLSINRKGNFLYARVKTVCTSDSVRQNYLDKIRRAYRDDKKAEKKLKKWADFSYNVSTRVYDCANKRYKILEITDYTADDRKIVKTKTPEKAQFWFSVGMDTMGDYTLYYICDY